MQEKVVGYGLLIISIGIILTSAVSVYMVFTKQSQPVKLFAFPGISIDLEQITTKSMQDQISSFLSQNQGTIPPELLQQFKKIESSPPQKQEIIPAAMINEPMNYMAHIFLMGFMATIGMKIGQLGTMLIRTINVNVKEKAS
jgi:hypothetical protein